MADRNAEIEDLIEGMRRHGWPETRDPENGLCTINAPGITVWDFDPAFSAKSKGDKPKR